MAKNYLNRYVWLIDIINRYGHITFPEISRQWQRSALNNNGEPLAERTFHNHRDAILETFGIEIKNDRSSGYYIENGSDWESRGARQWMLESLSLNNTMNECVGIRERVLFEQIPSSKRWLSIIVNAMKDNKSLELTYQSYNRTEPHTFEAYPFCLKLFKQRWYLLAKSEAYDNPRIYSLDRMIEAKETTTAFYVPKDFDAELFFRDHFGIIIGDDVSVERIKLKVEASQVKYYRSLPLHRTQKEIETTEHYSIFEYMLAPTFDFWQEVLSKGDTVEVLAPESFRSWIADTIANLNTIYHKGIIDKTPSQR